MKRHAYTLISVALMVAAFLMYLFEDNGWVLALTFALAAFAMLGGSWIRNWYKARAQKYAGSECNRDFSTTTPVFVNYRQNPSYTCALLGLSEAQFWRSGMFLTRAVYLDTASYFNFTKSKTKIAHTPTVIGNCTSTASRIAVPLGSTNVSANIAKAVSIPRVNLVFEFIVVLPP
jgi:hypothetical protein